MVKNSFRLVILLILGYVELLVAFPKNLDALNKYDNVLKNVFTGKRNEGSNQTLHVQLLKTLTIGRTKRIAVAGREKLYLLDPAMTQDRTANESFGYTEAFSWKSTKNTKELCKMKGQSQENCQNYLSVLQLSDDEEMLICGTNSYNPMCRKYRITITNNEVFLTFNGNEMSGRQRSPYGPNMSTKNLYSGGSLYSATYSTFFGGLSLVSRTMGQAPALLTNTDNVMNDPDFVKMTEDDERVLIFFNENEVLSTGEKRTIPQVAQVCKNDVGGVRILNGLFTTFIKSRLNCSYNGYYLDQVSDVTNPIRVADELVLFATFATKENSLAGSAVCSFKLSSVKSALSGPFLVGPKTTSRVTNIPPAPARHPGLCPTEKLPDDELLFVKSHPQMEKQVAGSLLLTNQGNRWTSIHALQISQPDSNTYILIGTENGHLIRALPPANDWPQGIIISDSDVFDKARCSSTQPDQRDRRITRILVENDVIFIAFKHCVVTVPLKWCSAFRCESSCDGAADPFCGWNGKKCIPLPNPRKIVKANLMPELRKPCPVETQIGKPNLKQNSGLSELEPAKVTSNKSATHSSFHRPEDPVQLEKAGGATHLPLVMVAVIASLSTLVLTTIVALLLCYCCRKHSKLSDDDETLQQKQSAELHRMAVSDGDKRSSFSRIAQQTYRGWKDLLTKATTPIQTPEMKLRSGKRRERRENEYTDSSKLKQSYEEDGETMLRRSKSRLDSSSTASSRQDSIKRNASTRPLLSPSSAAETDVTLPRSVANAATLQLSPKRVNQSFSSPVRSSETSFVTSDKVCGVHDSVVPNNSAQLRRSEHARRQANDIMRESGSGTAVLGIESVLKHMEEQGLTQEQLDSQRQRLESDDSGKGESPRNSCPAEIEKADEAKQARIPRPMSMNVQKRPPMQRTRLLSEGSHPFSNPSAIIVNAPPHRERHHSGQNLMHSQAGTPMHVPPRLSANQVNRFAPADFVVYGTAPRNERAANHCYNQPNQYEAIVPAQCFQTVPEVVYSSPMQVYAQRPPKMQRQLSEPQSRAQVGRSYSTSTKSPPNYYASLQQEKAQQNPVMRHSHEQPKHPEQPGPMNHYPSLPHRSSAAPYGDNNSYVTGNGFERPATLHKREKLPSIMRQSSAPNATRGVLFVPPPTIPNNGIM